jgi:hypothetical protein
MINAVFLLLCRREIVEKKALNFFKRINKKMSKNKIDINIFYDQYVEDEYILEIENYIKDNLQDTFQNINFINCDIDPENNNESRFQKKSTCGIYGNNSGSASLFYFAINYDVDKYQTIMILEWDLTFLCDGWIDIINDDINDKLFYIYGSKYYGSQNLNYVHKNHLNGVAVYNRTLDFMIFINKINNFHKTAIKLSQLICEGYDCVINRFIQKYKYSPELFIDSKYIINLSPTADKNIQLKKINQIKNNAIVIHQKY